MGRRRITPDHLSRFTPMLEDPSPHRRRAAAFMLFIVFFLS